MTGKAGRTGGAGAREQVARLLTLVPYLHARGEVRLDEAATALGVGPEQLLSDLKLLFMCGLPGGYPDDLIDVDLDALETEDGRMQGEGVIRVSNADYLARPLRLTPTEASAVIVALRTLRAGAEPATVEIIDRALVKLEQAAASAPAGGGPRTVPADAAPEAAEVDVRAQAARLGDAVSRQVQVRLDYYVPARDELSRRVVDPRGVVEHDGFTYLDAWCHSAEAPRLFRLDRVARAEVLDTPVTTEPTAPRRLDEGLFDAASDISVVTLRLDPEASWVPEYYPVDEVRPTSGGGLEVDLRVADERWLARLLLRLAPHASVVSDDDASRRARDLFTATAQAVQRLYRPGGHADGVR